MTSPAPTSSPLCPACDYDRAGLPDTAPCPECGAPAPPPGPPAEPTSTELFVRTILRPRTLWADLSPSPRDAVNLVTNAITGSVLFMSAALIFAGIPIVENAYRHGGPADALGLAMFGTMLAALFTFLFCSGPALAIILGSLLTAALARLVAGLFAPVRSTRFIKPVAAHALFPLVAWGLAAWAVVILTAAATLGLLAAAIPSAQHETLYRSAARLILAFAAAAAPLHTAILIIWGILAPSPEPRSGASL